MLADITDLSPQARGQNGPPTKANPLERAGADAPVLQSALLHHLLLPCGGAGRGEGERKRMAKLGIRLMENNERLVVRLINAPRDSRVARLARSVTSKLHDFVVYVMRAQLSNYEYESGLQRGSTGPVFFMWMLTEPMRYYFGYSGNLQERVSS
jgi:hypothetical protein